MWKEVLDHVNACLLGKEAFSGKILFYKPRDIISNVYSLDAALVIQCFSLYYTTNK